MMLKVKADHREPKSRASTSFATSASEKYCGFAASRLGGQLAEREQRVKSGRERQFKPTGSPTVGSLSVPRLAPCTVKAAQKLVKGWHRHLPDVQGGLFAVRVIADGRTIGVGLAGNPCYRWQGQAKLVISRVATDGAENACSMIYGALCRAAKALGYAEVWTYTLPEEPGTSLRAAGFMDMGMTRGGEYDRPSRSRAPVKRPEPKRRWLRQLAARPSMDGGAG